MPLIRIALPVALLMMSSLAAAQGLAAYLPPVAAARASKLIAVIDQASSTISARRASAWAAETAAQAIETESYALIAASRAGQGPWASPDGSAKAAEASGAFSTARAKAKASALALASGDDGSSLASSSRDDAAESLAKLILGSGIAGKAALGLERNLGARSMGLGLFPEIAEIESLLRKAGSAGARTAASAFSPRSAEGIALALIASKSRILELAPEAAGPLARLELDSRAYRGWLAAFAVAAFPGDLDAASDVEKAALVSGVRALEALRPERAKALIEAMTTMGDSRDAAAAWSARILAEAWLRSSESRRRDMAAACGLPESALASFSSALAQRPKGQAAAAAPDPLAVLRTLNGLAVSIADEEESSVGARGPEPALILLEQPILAAVARSEPRFASLFAEASRRLGAIYAQSAEDACTRLEASPGLTRAANSALGAAPVAIALRAVDLSLPPEESGRRLAFVATVSDKSGASLSMPVGVAEASGSYAAAFAKAAGLDPSGINPGRLLAKYGQCIIAAYDPETSDASLVMDSFPVSGGPSRLSELELELAMLGGWRP